MVAGDLILGSEDRILLVLVVDGKLVVWGD